MGWGRVGWGGGSTWDCAGRDKGSEGCEGEGAWDVGRLGWGSNVLGAGPCIQGRKEVSEHSCTHTEHHSSLPVCSAAPHSSG